MYQKNPQLGFFFIDNFKSILHSCEEAQKIFWIFLFAGNILKKFWNKASSWKEEASCKNCFIGLTIVLSGWQKRKIKANRKFYLWRLNVINKWRHVELIALWSTPTLLPTGCSWMLCWVGWYFHIKPTIQRGVIAYCPQKAD